MPNAASGDVPESRRVQMLLASAAGGALTSAMISLGMRLGLYGAMAGAGPVGSDDLAGVTGLHERWVREWLRQQAAAGVVEHAGGGRFELPAEAVPLLADERSLSYMGSTFLPMPHRIGMVERLPDAFRTGVGLTWDDRGAEASEWTGLLLRNWYQQVLVPVALPLLEDVAARLEAGAKVADVGCGTGVALIEMAKSFGRSEFHGYEVSEHALSRAKTNSVSAGVANVILHQARTDPLPGDGSYDLITTFDCVHDMTAPDSVARAIRASLRPDGVWFIVDINGRPTFEENLASNPLASNQYAMSVLSCLSSALSEPGGAGFGTLGLPEPAMRALAERAGFRRFRRLDLTHPFNAYYEARP